jgi:hypothetical protein
MWNETGRGVHDHHSLFNVNTHLDGITKLKNKLYLLYF